MGVLVKTAQTVENRVEQARRQLEPRFRLKLREAHTGWLELKSRSSHVSTMKRAELRLKVLLQRTDARVRVMLSKLLGRIIVELEKVRLTLPRE